MGVTNIIPIFGPFLGAVPSAFLILLVSPRQCLYFILFIIALQQFDGNILGPKILGKSTGISSFWVIVAIVVGGGFGGVLGMFLGVPIFACINSLVHWFTDRTLAKKGVTDDALFDPAPIPPADEKRTDSRMKAFYRENKGLHRWLLACGAVLVLFPSCAKAARR